MIISLGLGGKLPRFPWLTVSLSLLLIGYFIWDYKNFVKVESEIKAAINESQLAAVVYDLFSEFCSSRGGSKDACRKYATLAGSKFYFDQQKLKNENYKISANESYRVARWNREFSTLLAVDSIKLQSLKSFPAYLSAKKNLNLKRDDIYKRYGLYSKNNQTLSRIFFAQFKHGGVAHLMFNLFALIMFGVYLEMRIEPITFLMGYFLGGFVGLASFFQMNPTSGESLVGASANISAIMGAFFIVFFRFRLKMGVLNVFSSRRYVFIPISIAFPLLYILTDLLGLESEARSFGGVAHSSHLAGLVVGMLVGCIENYVSPIKWPFRNSQELDRTRSIKQLKSLRNRSLLAKDLCQSNPDNIHAHLILLGSTFLSKDEMNEMELNQVWREHLPLVMNACYRNQQIHRVVELLKKTPLKFDLSHALRGANRIVLLEIADLALERRELSVAIRLYDAFVEANPNSPNAPLVEKTMQGIFANCSMDIELSRFCESYLTQNPRSVLAKQGQFQQPNRIGVGYVKRA